MNPRILSLLLAACAPAFAQSAPTSAPAIPADAQRIVARELLAHAHFLASDELQGRDTGSPGQEVTARYVATRFEQWGLEPMGDEKDGKRGWFQGYDIERRTLDPKKTFVRAGADKVHEGLIFFPKDTEPEEVAGKLVFCGAGRRGRQGGKNDFADKPVKDNLAVMLMRGRKGVAGLMSGGNPARDRANAAKTAGAKACIILAVGANRELEEMAIMFGMYPGQGIVRHIGAKGMGAMMQEMADMFACPIPTTVVADPDAVRTVLTALKLDADKVLAQLGEENPAAFPAGEPVDGELSFAVTVEEKKAHNVVGLLRGSDPTLATEAVVFSAHMDHVGVRYDGDVFNGADDNASGTSGLLEIARAFAESGERPKRSLLFLSVSGEEKGLWGSAWYAAKPTWPVKQIVADVNTDMIGRSGEESGPDEVTVTPSYRHAKFNTLVRDAFGFAQALGIGFTDGDKYFERSDHYNFALKGIPVVFFCSGEHPDYHRPSDTSDKLDGKKMERIARLAFLIGRHAANAPERPVLLGTRKDWDAAEGR